ncbi:hypothetical protein A4A49_09957 [Nicotiana attenuata]|uniref:Uncharacterized protein n=1 Tax=Nicotiana attenuata TaxID=49451 RepID=A0A1J6ID57_NICAT|nr:hypothetical protein A4A49_09957 [Nicotiana attenuata]
MVLLTPPPTPIGSTSHGGAATTTGGNSSKGLVVSLMGSMNSLWAYWKKKPTRSTKSEKLGDNSSLAKPKKFLAKISGKAINFRHKKKTKNEEDKKEIEDDEDFGDGGLWQRDILMGDKCQPLDFSGVIYYDRNGKRLSELPMKSPRASPLPSYLYASSKSAELK